MTIRHEFSRAGRPGSRVQLLGRSLLGDCAGGQPWGVVMADDQAHLTPESWKVSEFQECTP
jgi:hypothetical protein